MRWQCGTASKVIRRVEDGQSQFSPTQQHLFNELSTHIMHFKRRLFLIFLFPPKI